MFGASVQEAAEDFHEFRLVQQEGVMTVVGLDLDEAHIRGDRVERMPDVA